MRLTSSLFIVSLVLTVIGVFGIADYLITIPGWEAAKKEAEGRLPNDEIAARERARNDILIVCIGALLGGIGSGVWAHLRYAGSMPVAEGSSRLVEICTICGSRLTRRQQARGICSVCQKKAG